MILDFVECCILFVLLCPMILPLYLFSSRGQPFVVSYFTSRISLRFRPFVSGLFSFFYYFVEFFIVVATISFLLNVIATIQSLHSAVSCG